MSNSPAVSSRRTVNAPASFGSDAVPSATPIVTVGTGSPVLLVRMTMRSTNSESVPPFPGVRSRSMACTITVPLIDQLVDIVKGAIGARGGVRMTGGGFGGCVVALVPQDLVEAARAAVQQHYRGPDGQQSTVYVCRAADGAGTLSR